MSSQCERAFPAGTSIAQLVDRLEKGEVTAEAIIKACLVRAADPNGDGTTVFPHGVAADARATARQCDADRGAARGGGYAGVPVSLKDNIAQAGQPLRAGSRFLGRDAPPVSDAALVTRLKAAGFVPIGRTNMTELAFSGLGLNPHYGTPANPLAVDTARAPGGSSSGAAASVGLGMAAVAIGTDTSGSCRIPAAFCGLVGFKPTAERIPLDGVYPLATSLDSVGVIGTSVDCCAAVDAVLADEPDRLDRLHRIDVGALRLADLGGDIRSDTDGLVARSYESALERLEKRGVHIEKVEVDILPRLAAINGRGGFGALELHAHLRDRLDVDGAAIDPRVLRRIARGEAIDREAAAAMRAARASLIAWANALFAPYDAVLMPTVAIVAPRLADLVTDSEYDRINLLALRNAGVANLLDRCAITIPCQPPGELAVGLSLLGAHGDDRRLLAIAHALEGTIRGA